GNADAGAEIGAAGDDGLHGLARALRADVLEHEVVPLEDARVLAERRRLVLPIVDLADGDFELIFRPRRRESEQRNKRERARSQHNKYRYHCRSSETERQPRVARPATSVAWRRQIARDAAEGARHCATGSAFEELIAGRQVAPPLFRSAHRPIGAEALLHAENR